MPYIITLNLPGCPPESDPEATETIEEAREFALDLIAHDWRQDDATHAELTRNIADIRADGGVLTGLPYGYVIDVQPVSWFRLARLAEADAEDHAAVLDAYNAR